MLPFSHELETQPPLDLKPLDVVVGYYIIMIVMLIITLVLSILCCIGMARGMHSARVHPVAERRTESVLRASGKISTAQTGSRPTGVSTSERAAYLYLYLYLYRWKPLYIPRRIYNMQICIHSTHVIPRSGRRVRV